MLDGGFLRAHVNEGTGYSRKGIPVLDINARRLHRAARKATNIALDSDMSLDALPAPEALLAKAEGRDRHDPHALGGIGRIAVYPRVTT